MGKTRVIYGLACALCGLVEWLPGKKLEKLVGITDAHSEATGGKHKFWQSLAEEKGCSIVTKGEACAPVLERLNIKEGQLGGLERFRS